MGFFSELIKRFSAPSPEFFIKLQNFGVLLGSVSTLLIGLHSQFPGVKIPDVVDSISGYMAVAGFLIAGVAKLTKQDNVKL